jgi:formate hydrogenlyase subunit 6/NADH:ubiquinone oxidoreductase subunit I
MTTGGAAESRVLERAHVQQLLDVLAADGYRIVGPTIRDGTLVYDDVRSTADLPVGWTDEQEAGTYRLKRRGDEALFGYVVGPHSWKPFLYPPHTLLWSARRSENGLQFVAAPTDVTKLAFVGARSCDLHAIATQDRAFMNVDPNYHSRRERLFVVAINCGLAGRTCFCASMGTGPRPDMGFDLALTEVLDGSRHYFVVETGTDSGARVIANVQTRRADASEAAEIDNATQRAVARMGRTMQTIGIKELLYRSYEHPRWDDVASRCLSCANCTMVCPTCFCSTVEEVSDLTGDHAERWRKWDSCFTVDFSYLHGGSIRASTRARYRQWLTHKLATWNDQFGTSGCVGCGRCITWCPVGIDITQEVRAIGESEATHGEGDD